MPSAAPNALTLAVAARRAAGRPLLDLTVSNPDLAGFGWPRAELAARLGAPGCERHEPNPLGAPAARAAIAAYYAGHGAQVDPARICLSASTSEAYTWWFRLLCEAGDSILAPEPAYPLVAILAEIARVRVIPYRLELRDGAWRVDLRSVRPEARTRALVVISPANPTGQQLHPDDLAGLRAAAPGCPVIVDEVFLDYAALGQAPRTHAGETAAPAIVLSGLSKVALAPQLKVGWSVVAGPADWAEPLLARLEHHADAFLSVNAPAQIALPALLAAAPSRRALVNGRLLANELVVRSFFSAGAHGVDVLPRDGGWSVVLRLPPGVDELALALRMVEGGALAHPGHYYDLEGHHLVLSLLTPEADLVPGLVVLRDALEAV